jgi:hypothetical protein
MTIAPGRYRHYKGGEYVVVGEALHTETEETLVLYHAVRDGVVGERMFARPELMFAETVEIDGRTIPRFAPLGSDSQS